MFGVRIKDWTAEYWGLADLVPETDSKVRNDELTPYEIVAVKLCDMGCWHELPDKSVCNVLSSDAAADGTYHDLSEISDPTLRAAAEELLFGFHRNNQE